MSDSCLVWQVVEASELHPCFFCPISSTFGSLVAFVFNHVLFVVGWELDFHMICGDHGLQMVEKGAADDGVEQTEGRVHRLNCWCLDHRVLFPEDNPHSPFRRAPSIGFPSGGTFASGSMASEDDIDPLFHGPLGAG
ncbi:hypothetical protein B296_00013955 [Ensete ventricosum]|uniref:Uncharacterized protein n=1 Tax=Ensete ventricosum TaxID=4639 RepID=A0A427AHI8_ENSVE|nr:hypothetical protein B296_00013955 [Ensete ventricosum]